MNKNSNLKWISVGNIDDIPFMGARVVKTTCDDIAVFKTSDGNVFSLIDKCPHKGGPLSQGIVHGNSVSCPLHNWKISLESGEAMGQDRGCTNTIPTEVREGKIFIAIKCSEKG